MAKLGGGRGQWRWLLLLGHSVDEWVEIGKRMMMANWNFQNIIFAMFKRGI
jgi:hypothetical protein